MADLIRRLAQLIAQDNAVLFVGASLRQQPDQPSALQQIADALATRIQYQRADRSLSAIARDFEVMQGRSALILALREELERLSKEPAPIHQLLADAVLPTTKVITTRFDRILEQVLDQFQKSYVLIVRDTDLPFFDASKITLIKLQGDISQPDSLVITEDDIDAFISKLPTISDVVRAFFATKSLIFLGYDLNSEHFKRLFRQVTRNLAGFRRQAYAVTAEPVDEVEQRYWQGQSVEICLHDPAAFLEELAREVKAAVRQPQPTANPLAQMAAKPLPPHPYKGLESFGPDDVAIFAGRNEESQRLTNRILAHRLTVLYGESGSGKTSLLQAGAAPRLAEQRALLSRAIPDRDRTLPELMRAALLRDGSTAGLEQPSDSALPTMIRTWQRQLDGPVVLAVDQFEQFFISYDGEEQQEALGVMRQLLDDRSLDLRLVLVLREDFLGRLQLLTADIPNLLDVRFRLDRLGREAARAAIEEPARLFGLSWETALVQQLLDDLHYGQEGGVTPPQLQIICDRLYREAAQGDNAGRRITQETFTKLGGSAVILGDYVDEAVTSFPAEQQPTVRTLLGALVSSSGLKQRLALDDLARAAEIESTAAASLLDDLNRQQLVRRYEVATTTGVGQLEYELTHEYLAGHIARWLGNAFWDAQRAREIVRQALPDWREHKRLLAPADLHFIGRQHGQVRFSRGEVELLFASAVSSNDQADLWGGQLDAVRRQELLLELLHHPESTARQGAALALGAWANEDVARALAQTSLTDSKPGVRRSAAQAIAQMTTNGEDRAHERAIAELANALVDPSTAETAIEALTRIRDWAPAAHEALPAALRGQIQRRVWGLRWQRQQEHILGAALQGIQGGFWGLGLGMGVFLGLYNVYSETGRLLLRTALGGMLLGLSLAGVLGALSVGSGALAGVTLRSLQDHEQKLRNWAAVTCISALFFSLGLVLIGYVSAGAARPLTTLTAGLIMGLGMAGAAAVPLRSSWPLHLCLAALTGICVFVLVGWLGLFFDRRFGWLILMGGAAGAGFFWGLNPGFWRRSRTLDECSN